MEKVFPFSENFFTSCAFALRRITCVFLVSELYRATYSGQMRKNSKDHSRALNVVLKNEIIKAAKYHFKNDKGYRIQFYSINW